MHADTVTALADPTTRRKLEELALFVEGSTPTELENMVKAERIEMGARDQGRRDLHQGVSRAGMRPAGVGYALAPMLAPAQGC